MRDFSKLPVPFKAVAANIETGEAGVLDHGDLAESIRASISIPGVFSPVEIGGTLLVDGGIVDNVPVDIVRAMGADFVIAIDVGAPLFKRDQLGSLLAVTDQMLTILTRQNTQKQIASADLVMTPPVSAWGTMSFEDARKIIDVGTAYAREQAPRLRQLAVPLAVYADSIASRPKPDRSNRAIDYLGIEGSRRVDNRIIRGHVTTRPGQPIDREKLRRDVTRLYGLDDFQTVSFSMSDESGQEGLVLNLKDKPWGPTYVRFGVNLTDDLKGASSYNFLVNITRTRVNRLGGEWRNDFHLGRDLGVASEFYQPLDFRGRFFVAPSVSIVRSTFSFFENERRVTLFNLDQRDVGVDLGIQFYDWGEMRLGVFRGRIDAGIGAGAADLSSQSIDLGGIRGSLNIIRTDSPSIPLHGSELSIGYRRQSFQSTDRYSRLIANGFTVFTKGRQSYFAGASAGTNLGTTIPVYDEFGLGGFLNVSGFAEGQIHGQRFSVLRLGTYRLLRQSGVYGGGFFELGDAWNDERNWHRSITAILGADTFIGPVFLAYARADGSHQRFYVTIGKTF